VTRGRVEADRRAEDAETLRSAFEEAGLSERLVLLAPGEAVELWPR
jgi:hypothetical protein